MIIPVLLALTVTLLPLPVSRIAGLTEYAVVICGDAPAPFSAGKVYQAAATRITPVPRAQAQAMLAEQAKGSGWRYVAPALKLAGLAFTGLQAAEVVKLNERRYQALAPAGTAVFQAVELLAGDRRPTAELPPDMLPPFVHLAAGGCGEFVIFARPQRGEERFEVEVR